MEDFIKNISNKKEYTINDIIEAYKNGQNNPDKESIIKVFLINNSTNSMMGEKIDMSYFSHKADYVMNHWNDK